MNALLVAVLAASLVGSLHCAGMCGPFLAFVVGAGPSGRGRVGDERSSGGLSATQLQAAYHLARGAGYLALGAAAGAAGHLLDLAGVLAGLAPLAAALAGATLVTLGVIALAQLVGLRWSAHVPLPAALARGLRALQARALALPPRSRALAIGATSALLPCGWLYAFAVTAAGTGHPLRGMAVLGVFWLGTLPVLVSLGALVRGAARAFGPRYRALASAALVLLGLWTLAGRAGLEPLALARAAEAAGAPGGDSSARSAPVPDPSATPPCCAAEPAPVPPPSRASRGAPDAAH